MTACALGILLLGALALAQAPRSVTLTVRETAGIRRSTFPVTAVVSLAQGAFAAGASARLLLNGAAVPVQVTPTATWPDGSARSIDVDFSASPGPEESLTFVFEYGDGVASV